MWPHGAYMLYNMLCMYITCSRDASGSYASSGTYNNHISYTQGYFYQISKGGHLRFWTFSKTNFGPFLTKDAKLWTFLYGV